MLKNMLNVVDNNVRGQKYRSVYILITNMFRQYEAMQST